MEKLKNIKPIFIIRLVLHIYGFFFLVACDHPECDASIEGARASRRHTRQGKAMESLRP